MGSTRKLTGDGCVGHILSNDCVDCWKTFATTQVLLLDHIVRGDCEAGSTRHDCNWLHDKMLVEVSVDWDISARLEDEQLLSPIEMKVLRTELLLNPSTVQSFVESDARGARLPRKVQQMALGWARGVEGIFVVVSHHASGTCMLLDETGAVYTVRGGSSSMLDELLAMGYNAKDVLCVRTCLLPHPAGSGEAVVFDGLVEVCSPVVDPQAYDLVACLRERSDFMARTWEPVPELELEVPGSSKVRRTSFTSSLASRIIGKISRTSGRLPEAGAGGGGLSAFSGLVERVARWKYPGGAWLYARDVEDAEGTAAVRNELLDRFFRSAHALAILGRPSRPYN